MTSSGSSWPWRWWDSSRPPENSESNSACQSFAVEGGVWGHMLGSVSHSDMCWSPQDLLFAVCDPSPGEHPLQEEDVPGRLHRHLQPGGASDRLRAPGGQSGQTPHDQLSGWSCGFCCCVVAPPTVKSHWSFVKDK